MDNSEDHKCCECEYYADSRTWQIFWICVATVAIVGIIANAIITLTT